MSEQGPLPEVPSTEVEEVLDRSDQAQWDQGFLRLRRLTLRNRYPDGSQSAPYDYDVVERAAIDAVAFLLFDARGPVPTVCLRSALRPPLSLRRGYALPFPEPEGAPSALWEVPAGLIEAEEKGEAGLRACASRESLEEVGLQVPEEAFSALGPPAFMSPGVMAEKVYFLCAEVAPEQRGTPTEDGSPVEEQAEVIFVPLPEALEAARRGQIRDLKSEIALRRLRERLSERPEERGR